MSDAHEAEIKEVVEMMAAKWEQDAPVYKALSKRTGQSTLNLLIWQLVHTMTAQSQALLIIQSMLEQERQEKKSSSIITGVG